MGGLIAARPREQRQLMTGTIVAGERREGASMLTTGRACFVSFLPIYARIYWRAIIETPRARARKACCVLSYQGAR